MRTPGTDSDWELTSPPFGMPDLEHVIMHSRCGYQTPKERPNEDLCINVSSMPVDIWDMIWYLRERYTQVETQFYAQGCLIGCGLHVIERMLKDGPRSREARKKAIKSNNLECRYRYIDQEFTSLYLSGNKSGEVKVFCLSENEKGRILEISYTYGLSLSTTAILVMIAGIAQSTSVLPRTYRERAERQIRSFEKWLNG